MDYSEELFLVTVYFNSTLDKFLLTKYMAYGSFSSTCPKAAPIDFLEASGECGKVGPSLDLSRLG